MSERPKIPQANVTVFGAGVAGMTAAHELVERGFEVRVMEPEPDPFNAGDCDVGGMARTQWSRVPRIRDARQRLEAAEMEGSQPIPPILGAELSEHRFPPWEREVVFAAGRAAPQGDPDSYLARRVAELVALIERVPIVDPYHRDRLYVPETVRFAGTWAEDDLPSDGALDVVRSAKGTRRVEEIVKAEAERDRCATPLELWRRALVVARCEVLMERFIELLEQAAPGRFRSVSGGNRRTMTIFRHLDEKLGQPVANLERVVLGDIYPQDGVQPPRERRVVRVFVDHNKLSGEHGYRFFPAFYRHVFDTMRRIPIAEPEPLGLSGYRSEAEEYFWKHKEDRRVPWPRRAVDTPQGRTVKDNLLPLQHHTITGPGGEAFKLSRTLALSLKGALAVIRDFRRALDLTLRDIARMEVKLLQYMTSCTARRDGYARKTWLEYLGGPYSEGFTRAMINWPRALVGLQADRADARTYGDVAVQLVLDQLRSDEYRDGTLNAPTSVAWLEPWRRYLQSQGVRFERGRLIDLMLREDGEGASIEGLILAAREGGTACEVVREISRGYLVIAVPPVEARQLAVSLRERARSIGGAVWTAFEASDFAAMAALLDADGREFQLEDLGRERIGGILQHYSGIQFFLDQDHALFTGHAYYADAPWALSSISQVQFRMDPPDPTDGYRGVVSVDVGSWDTHGLDGAPSAWCSTSDALANEVWRQICASTGVGAPNAERRPSKPRWYHIDQAILRRGDEHGATVALGLANMASNDEELRGCAERSPVLAIDSVAGRLRAAAGEHAPYFNRSPYVVSVAGSWERSPGQPGNYSLLHGVVMAGSHMQTHTRLATMEAANESGRHAANAILTDYKRRVQAQGREMQLDIRVGEPCETWPLVDRELPDLDFLKKIDAALVRRGLPHMFEILEVEQIVDELVPCDKPVDEAAGSRVDVVDKIVAALEQLTAARPSSAGAFMLAPLEALLAGLRGRR